MSNRWPTIPEPVQTLASLQSCVIALKMNMELVTGQRGPVASYSIDQQVLDLQTTVTKGPLSLTAQIITLNSNTVDLTNASSLASQINLVKATANSATATGSVKLSAVAGLSGTTAGYQWTLTAGGYSVGMTAYAMSGGGAKIGFSASNFALTDSGTLQNVFSYSGGVFNFNAPVKIQTADITDGAITSAKIGTLQVKNANIDNLTVGNSNIQNSAATQGAGSNSPNTNSATCFLTCRGTGTVAVFATFYGSNGNAYLNPSYVGKLYIYMDGVYQFVVLNAYTAINVGGSPYVTLMPTVIVGTLSAVGAGSHSFQAYDDTGIGSFGVSIVAIELSK